VTLERIKIRSNIESLLVNDSAVTALVSVDNIHRSRMRALEDVESLPAILIYTTGESLVEFNAAPLTYSRSVDLNIQIIGQNTAAGGDLEDEIDRIGQAVENVIHSNDTLKIDGSDFCVQKLRMTGVSIDYDVEASRQTAALNLRFSVEYDKQAPASGADGVVDDLLKASIKYDLHQQDGIIEQEDCIETPLGA